MDTKLLLPNRYKRLGWLIFVPCLILTMLSILQLTPALSFFDGEHILSQWTTIKVPDMMCENCVKRITNALTAAELTFRVDLAAKNVTIDGCENCVKTAVSELEDLGFTPEVQG